MNNFQIRWIAISAMVCDHVGLFLFPQILWLRVVGRLAFPLFAWGIANGLRHTRDVRKYLQRLLVVGVVSQVPYWGVFAQAGFEDIQLNIFFTLAMGVIAVMGARRFKEWWKRVMIVIAVTMVTLWLGMDYGGYGVIMIAIFYFWYGKLWWLVGLQIALVFGFYVLQSFLRLLESGVLNNEPFIMLMQLVSVGAMIVIGSYNGKEGRKMGWWGYGVYGGHLAVLWGMKAVGF